MKEIVQLSGSFEYHPSHLAWVFICRKTLYIDWPQMVLSPVQELHPYLKAHSTSNPEEATLFYIPIYTAQLYHSLLLDQRLNHADSLNQTAEAVRRALSWVKDSFPFWNRLQGMDHFMVAPLDHGRCSSLAGLTHQDFGNMFTIQSSGDHLLRDFETHSWQCYQPGRDLLIPLRTEARFTLNDIVKPGNTARYISILYRFVGGGRGDYGILRNHILNQEQESPIPGSVAGWHTVNGTHEDMQHSVFCVCPPGIAQHTLRIWRAIIFGCIPVTLFTANDVPYQHYTHLDYSKFTVNINPSEWYLLQPVINGLLNRPERIAELQSELARVQSMFLWDSTSFDGAHKAVLNELAIHPSQYLRLSRA